MNENVQPFFTPYESFLKQTLETIQKVYSFQLTQRNRLYQLLSKKYAYAKKECFNSTNKNKALMQENKMLKDLYVSSHRVIFRIY